MASRADSPDPSPVPAGRTGIRPRRRREARTARSRRGDGRGRRAAARAVRTPARRPAAGPSLPRGDGAAAAPAGGGARRARRFGRRGRGTGWELGSRRAAAGTPRRPGRGSRAAAAGAAAARRRLAGRPPRTGGCEIVRPGRKSVPAFERGLLAAGDRDEDVARKRRELGLRPSREIAQLVEVRLRHVRDRHRIEDQIDRIGDQEARRDAREGELLHEDLAFDDREELAPVLRPAGIPRTRPPRILRVSTARRCAFRRGRRAAPARPR